MKKILLFSALCLMAPAFWIAQSDAKPFFGTVSKYINIHDGNVIEIGSPDISEDQKTATYYDYGKSKRLEVNMLDYSKSTSEEIAGVRAGEMILIKIKDKPEPCEVWYLFENQMATIACKTDKMAGYVGVDRPLLQRYTVFNVQSPLIIPEVSEKDGFKKHDFATMREGQKVRIEAIFDNGEVLVQKMNISFLDTSAILMKYNIIRTNLNELNK